MKLTLTIHSGWGTTTTIHIFKAENIFASPNDYTCKVVHKNETSQGTISVYELQDLFTLIRTARITPIIKCELLLDVSIYILKIEDDMSKAEYEWSVTNEKGWKKLDTIAERILGIGRKISGWYL